MNSFDTGAIFPTEVGQDLSRNAFVASILSLEKNPTDGKVSRMTPKLTKFEKVLSGKPKLNFSGPAGGSHTTRENTRKTIIFCMLFLCSMERAGDKTENS